MKNPYDILNVSESASDEEINRAYKALARKYHPDINPSKDAAEKMVEINCAYDEIKKMRANGESFASYSRQNQSYSNNYAQSNYSSYSSYQSSYEDIYRQIGELLNMGYTFMVYQLLNSIPQNNRDARWYYYASVFYYQNRNINSAIQYIDKAIALDPNNNIYINFKTRLTNMNVRETYATRRGFSLTNILWRFISVIIIIQIIEFLFFFLFGGWR